MSPRLSLIGGYLGSGKSTLVNRLLSGALPGRTAVVVNDFGSVNIDADLIIASDGDTIELSNGCICCQISDDVSRTMSALAVRTDLDNVICEVSGVGDPGELAAWRSYPGFTPGPVVVVADAISIAARIRDQYVGDTVARQLGSAEIVLITKTDLATEAQIKATLSVCEAAAPRAIVVQQDPTEPEFAAAAIFAAVPPPHPMAGEHRSDSHVQMHSTCTMEFSGPIDVDALELALGRQAQRLVRAKGIMQHLDGRWLEVQLAAGRIAVTERRAGAPVLERASLVLIAAGADREESLETAGSELRAAMRTVPASIPGITARTAPAGGLDSRGKES